jgi:hypothetical protein
LIARIGLVCALCAFLTGAAFAAPPWPHGDPNIVVRSVLAQPAFRDASGTADRSALQRLLQILGDRLRQLFRWLLRGANGSATWLGVTLGYVTLSLAVAAAAFALASALLSRSWARSRTALRGRAAPLEQMTPERLREQAASMAEAGEFAFAIALLFRGALLALDRAAIVAFDASRTPGEYRRLVRRALSLASSSFDDLAARFVRASFASAAPLRPDYEAAARAYATFVPLAAPT